MRSNILAISAVITLSALTAAGQGTFIFDQQSSIDGNYLEGGADIQQNQPIGQSFIPQLSSVGFVRLYIYTTGRSATRDRQPSTSTCGPDP